MRGYNYKILILIPAFFVFSAVKSFAITEKTDSALVYYSNSEYQKALDIYLSFIEEGYSSSGLFYNIGNCYYKLSDLPAAILWFERAKILNPSNEDIQVNLKIANSQIKNQQDELPQVFYVTWYNQILNLFNSNSWAWLSFVFFIMLLSSAAVYLFTSKTSYKKIAFIIGVIMIVCTSLSLLFSIQQKNKQINNTHAIVFEYSLVKSSPSEQGSNLFEIHEGLKVEVLETLNDWSNIRLSDGKQGWLPSQNIEQI